MDPQSCLPSVLFARVTMREDIMKDIHASTELFRLAHISIGQRWLAQLGREREWVKLAALLGVTQSSDHSLRRIAIPGQEVIIKYPRHLSHEKKRWSCNSRTNTVVILHLEGKQRRPSIEMVWKKLDGIQCSPRHSQRRGNQPYRRQGYGRG